MESEQFLAASAGSRLALIPESYERLTRRPLLEPGETLWTAPFIVLAHGAQGDPIFFYGNRLALELFELAAEEIVRMPSRLSAEALDRSARARLLDQVARHGFIDDYAGVRVSKTGRRFRIERATVWNLADGGGAMQGQAAMFANWTRLD